MHSSWAGIKSIKVLASGMMGFSVLTGSSGALTIQKSTINNRLQNSKVTLSFQIFFGKKKNVTGLSEVRTLK